MLRLVIIFLILFTSPALAAQKFEVDKSKSSIKFEAIQDGSPQIGEFKSYAAQIEFDPKDLATSKAVVEIDMASISSSYTDMIATLTTPEWFDSDKFPKAKFETVKFAGDNKNYTAQSNLTIRGITKPVTLSFSLPRYDKKGAVIDGIATVRRSDFGIGWKNTNSIKDEVKVTIHIEANPTP